MAMRRERKGRSFRIIATMFSEKVQSALAIIADAEYTAELYITNGDEIWMFTDKLQTNFKDKAHIAEVKARWERNYPMWALWES